MTTRDWLCAICSNPRAISHFIALLAELESIGAHKIRCCVDEHDWGEPEKRHLGQESKHALLFEKLLQKKEWRLNGIERDKMRELAHEYFQPLDHGSSDRASGLIAGYSPRLCYLLVSYLVERRAIEVYREFHALCAYADVKVVIQEVIDDEEGHLLAAKEEIDRVFKELGQAFEQEEFADLEERLYARLQSQFLATTLGYPKAAA